MAIAIGPEPPGEEGQGRAGVRAQLPGAPQPDDTQKEQGQQQALDGGRTQAGHATGGGLGWSGERGGQGWQEAGFMHSGQEEQTPGALLPRRAGTRIGVYVFF